jgi:phage tail sheath protein FI
MPEYLAPGVYVEEVDTGSKPIEGVSTSTAGVVGVTERGPVNVPILVTSFGEFTRWFGGYLNPVEFEEHCYLPHAVEGFFTNGGKRLYVARVLDTVGAVRATGFLFDRGSNTSASTLLLRTAGELTGTVANQPLLVALDASTLKADDWIRIGEGSAAEYAQVDVPPVAENTLVPVHLPLNRTHAVGDTVEQFDRTTAGGVMSIIADSTGLTAGAQSMVIDGANADITFLSTNPNQLLEIGGPNTGEYRFAVGVSNVTPVSPTNSQATVRLDSPLLLPYPNGAAVERLDTAPINGNAVADSAPGAGDRLVFVNSRGGQFSDRTKLIVINSADPGSREARRIGALRQISIEPGAYEEYPAGTVVRAVAITDQQWTLGAPTLANDTVATLNSSAGLVAGQTLLVGPPGPNQDPVVIRTLGPGANMITLAVGMPHPHANGDAVIPAPRTLSVDTSTGASFIALSNRVGLVVGDLLRVGVAPDDEYVTIMSLPARAPAGTTPDAGNAMVAPALRVRHPANTVVARPVAPALVAGRQAAALVLSPRVGDATILISDGDAYVATDFVRLTTSSGEVFYHRISAAPTTPTPDVVTLRTALRRAHPTGAGVVGRAPLFRVEALDAGGWGNRLRVSVEDESPALVKTAIKSVTNSTHIRLASVAGVEPGTLLELTDPLNGDTVLDGPLKVVSVDRSTNFTVVLDGTGLSAAQQTAETNAAAGGKHLGVRSREFRMTVFLFRQADPSLPSRGETILNTEVFRYLSMDSRHSRYLEKVIGSTWTDVPGATQDDGFPPRPLRLDDRRSEGESGYVRVHDLALDLPDPPAPAPNKIPTLESARVGPETLLDTLPSGSKRAARHALETTLGYDSIATLFDSSYVGVDDPEPLKRTGLLSLRNEEEISIVAIPGRTSAAIQGALIDHCEFMRYRFAVLDAGRPPGDSLNDVQTQRQQFDTKYASLYHPWPLIADPFPINLGAIMDYPIPPSGHVMGIYARTDIERGVHKAPANEVVRGIIGLQRILNKGEQDILNPYPVNVNVIRDFRPNNRGIRIWGGRVITSDPDWKYVNVRRLLIFIEASIDRGLQWVVFEPNAEPLWARVNRTVSNFLTSVWRDGGLEGTKPEEAYYVKVDRTTMTQTDIDSGHMIVVIGVAPVKPAEFVIIRIGLWTAHADS